MSNLLSKKYLLPLLILVVALTITFMALSAKAQSLFYYPDNVNYGASPTHQGLSFEEARFTSVDGTSLHGWFVPAVVDGKQDASQALGTVIHMHGNAANITNHWPLVQWLPEQGFNLLVFDYRGYGQSDPVKPTDKGLFEDSQAAINYARNREDVDSSKLLILGQSLGGNNAVAALGEDQKEMREGVCAVVLDSTFYSYSSIANDKFFGAGLFMSNQFAASRHIKALGDTPLLFIHGKADQVIPYQHSERLYELNDKKGRLILITNMGHIAALDESHAGKRFTQKVSQFYQESLKTCAPATVAE